MTKDNLCKVLITSPPDRDSIVAEVYFGNIQFAELSIKGSSVACELYPRNDGRPWHLGLSELRDALSVAERKLTGHE